MSLSLAIGGVAAALAGGRWMMARRVLGERSPFFLGRTPAEVRALSEQAGADLERFCQLAQRVLWGIVQPDLIRVDVPAAAAALVAAQPDFFASYLVRAFAERSLGREEAAEAALAAARERLTPGHPLASVMPSADEWACAAPQPALEEVVPGAIWRVPAYFTHGHTPFHEFAYATIVRRRSGEVAVLNPVTMTPQLAAAVAALGPVTHLVTPVKFHNLFIAEAQALFPGARTIGVPGHRKNPPSAHLRFDGFLDPKAPLFPGDLEEVAIAGHQFEETAFFHRESRTAIFHDVLFANQIAVPGYLFWWRLYALVFGVFDEVAVASYHPMLWTNLPALRRSLLRVLAWDAERVLIGHAPGGAIPSGGAAALRRAFAWVAELGVAEYTVLVSAYFRAQPGFLRDNLRYLVRQGL